MEESRWGEKEVEVNRMNDQIKNKCYIVIRGIYTTLNLMSYKNFGGTEHSDLMFKSHDYFYKFLTALFSVFCATYTPFCNF